MTLRQKKCRIKTWRQDPRRRKNFKSCKQ